MDRIAYVVTELPDLIFRGPFCEMAFMTYFQSTQKYQRGIIFDAMHFLYLPYVDLFITNDNHFAEIGKSFDIVNTEKVVLIREAKIDHHQFDVPDSGTIITEI